MSLGKQGRPRQAVWLRKFDVCAAHNEGRRPLGFASLRLFGKGKGVLIVIYDKGGKVISKQRLNCSFERWRHLD
jgi:hypothetical protein